MTPCSKAIAQGRHSVSLVLTRYDPLERAIDVNSPLEVREALTPQFGWLTIRTDPGGLKVNLDGTSAGVTPLQRLEVAPGDHEVVIDSPLWFPDGKVAYVGKAEEKQVDITARPRMGGLRVIAQDQRGNDLSLPVVVDGAEVGVTPWAGELQVGPHAVVVGSWTGSMTVAEATTEEVAVEVTVDPAAAAHEPTSAPTTLTSSGSTTARSLAGAVHRGAALIVDWTMSSAPPRIMLTEEDSSLLTFTAMGRPAEHRGKRATAADGLDLRIDTNIGHLDGLRSNGGGRYLVSYRPAENLNKPAFALFSILDVRFPDTSVAFFVLPLVANIPWQIDTGRASIRVSMDVGGESFGPVTSGAGGDAIVPIRVPPGTTTASATVFMPDGSSTPPQPIDLLVPPFSQIKIAPPGARLHAGTSTPTFIYVIGTDGTPATGAKIEVAARLGTVSPVTQLGNGLYQTTYHAPLLDGITPFTAVKDSITASLPGMEVSVDTVEFQVTPVR